MESVRPVFECMTCKAFPTIESVPSENRKKCHCHGNYACSCYPIVQPKCRNGHDTGKIIRVTNLDELEWQIKLLSTIPHPCKNGKYGCKEIAMPEELPLHEDICDYRKVNCVVGTCTADVCYLKYMEHFNKDHSTKRSLISSKKNAGLYSINASFHSRFTESENIVKRVQTFVAFDRTFFDVRCFQNGFVYRWIVLVGFREEAEKYYYQASIENPTNVNDKITFSGKVRSLDETRKDIMAEQKCFIVGKQTCKNLMDEHEKIHCSFELRNLKEEAKDENEESGIDDDDESQSSVGVL